MSVIINLFKRKPGDESKPLIDFHIAVALTPCVLVGTLDSWDGPGCGSSSCGGRGQGKMRPVPWYGHAAWQAVLRREVLLLLWGEQGGPGLQGPLKVARLVQGLNPTTISHHACHPHQVGVSVGVLLNVVFPPWLLTALLLLLILFLIFQSYIKVWLWQAAATGCDRLLLHAYLAYACASPALGFTTCVFLSGALLGTRLRNSMLERSRVAHSQTTPASTCRAVRYGEQRPGGRVPLPRRGQGSSRGSRRRSGAATS